ncbi:MAG: hypothetical protein AB1831_03320 [Pseudomonadota bacterium]
MRLIALLAACAFSTAAAAANVIVDRAIPGFASPESVAVAGDDVFVSNLGVKLEPMEKDGDGFISRLDRQGNVKALRWADKLNGPKGLLVLQGVVYVADIDRVLGFRVRDGKQVFDLDLSATGARFLNALARHDNRTLLVSATDLNKVFSIDLMAKKYAELAFDTPLKGPNGLKRMGSRLIVVEWGTDGQANGAVKTFRLEGMSAKLDKEYKPEPAGYFDGVVDIGANRWLVSNWVKFEPAGLLQVLDTRTGQIGVANDKLPIAGPADICLDDQGKLWVPGMMEGKVYRMTLRR